MNSAAGGVVEVRRLPRASLMPAFHKASRPFTPMSERIGWRMCFQNQCASGVSIPFTSFAQATAGEHRSPVVF